VVERQPRVRFGQVHLFNNLYTSTTTNYCIGVGVGANIRDESNVFVGVKTPVNTTSYSDSASAVRSTNNVYTNTTNSVSDLNASSVFDPTSDYSYTADAASSVQATVQSGAGPM
jgi:pectate lyase